MCIRDRGSRGQPRLKLNLDTLEVICNGCRECEEACPQGCINIINSSNKNDEGFLEMCIRDRRGKKF